MRLRGTGVLALLALAAVTAYAVVTLTNTRARLTEAARTQAELQEEIERLQESNAALSYAIENRDDPATIEDVAREKLGLVMPDERIYYDSGD